MLRTVVSKDIHWGASNSSSQPPALGSVNSQSSRFQSFPMPFVASEKSNARRILKVVGSNIQRYRREREISTPLDGECLSVGVLAGDESL